MTIPSIPSSESIEQRPGFVDDHSAAVRDAQEERVPFDLWWHHLSMEIRLKPDTPVGE